MDPRFLGLGYLEVSGQLHTPAALPPEERASLPGTRRV
jgi:hypothetical protein